MIGSPIRSQKLKSNNINTRATVGSPTSSTPDKSLESMTISSNEKSNNSNSVKIIGVVKGKGVKDVDKDSNSLDMPQLPDSDYVDSPLQKKLLNYNTKKSCPGHHRPRRQQRTD